MSDFQTTTHPALFGWRRLRVALGAAVILILLLSPGWEAEYSSLVFRPVFIALAQLVAFGVLERWPRRLPRWLARWVLQVIGVALVAPLATWFAYTVTTLGDPIPWHLDRDRMTGFMFLTFVSVLTGPWLTMSALYRQISGAAQRQALAFELERSEFERTAAQSRLHLLQAQVEPHFLFNTLANVRELVDAGSPHASPVLGHLIAYLRAAVPRLHDSAATLTQEIELVRAYLALMHMRMPDRLQYRIETTPASEALRLPPMSLLTLVENAIRHGIDPSEDGGEILVRVQTRGAGCLAEVIDTGVGLGRDGDGLGTGLSTLRERLRLAYGDTAELRLRSNTSRGVHAEIEFPCT